MLGTAYEDKHVATGYGAYIALPLMREALEKKANLTQQEALNLLTKCMEVLFYRDGRTFNKVRLSNAILLAVDVRLQY